MSPEEARGLHDSDLRGFRYFHALDGLLDRLRDDGTARDRAGRREPFYGSSG